MKMLIRTFAARFIAQDDVDTFSFTAEELEEMQVKPEHEIFIGELCATQLDMDEGEGVIDSAEKRRFYR